MCWRRRCPVAPALTGRCGVPVHLKLESHQRDRQPSSCAGATNACLSLTADATRPWRRDAASTGNHGQGAGACRAMLKGGKRDDLHVEPGAGQQGRGNPTRLGADGAASSARSRTRRRRRVDRLVAEEGHGHGAALRSCRRHRRPGHARAGNDRGTAGCRNRAGAGLGRWAAAGAASRPP